MGKYVNVSAMRIIIFMPIEGLRSIRNSHVQVDFIGIVIVRYLSTQEAYFPFEFCVLQFFIKMTLQRMHMKMK